MPADIRLSSITFNPSPPVAGEPFTIYAQCLNVGDEGTGQFIARFLIDGSETIDNHVDNIAPNESAYAWCPHAGMAEGNHSVHCTLDAGHTVAEPEERFNSQTQYFTVSKHAAAPADTNGSEYYDDNALATAVKAEVSSRVNHWMLLVVQAVDEWDAETQQRIEQWDFNGDVQVDLMGVVAAFGQAVASRIPGGSTAMGVVSDANSIISAIRAYAGNPPLTEAGAKAKLRTSVQHVRSGAGTSLRKATDGYETRLAQWLSPDNDNSPLAQVQKGSTDPAFVAQITDWLGFTPANEGNTTEPIKKELTDSFNVVFEQVAKQMWKESGYN